MEKDQELHSDSQDSELLNLQNEQEDEDVLPEADTSQLMQEKEQDGGGQIQENAKIMTQKIFKEFQHIYIAAYSVYRQKLQQLAFQLNCQLQFKKKCFVITCRDQSKSKSWQKSKDQIIKQIQSIIYLKIEQKDKKFKIYNSPYTNKIINQKGIYVCSLNNQVYLHSNQYQQKELIQQKKTILKNLNIFPVNFCRKPTLDPIDHEISSIYKVICEEYYKEKFQKSNLVVQLTNSKKCIYVVGLPGAKAFHMMEGKKTVKSIIQSLSIISFKNHLLETKDQTVLRDYLKRISAFPIRASKLKDNIIIILSKDHILRDLLKKTKEYFTKIQKGQKGQKKSIKTLGISQTTEMGIYIPACISRGQKKVEMDKVCKEMEYDYWGVWGIRYFRPMISTEEKNINQTLELLIRILGGFYQVKEKFEIMKTKKPQQTKIDAKKRKQMQQQSKYAYIQKNSVKDSKQLTKLLRGDVMQDQILMKNRYNHIYALIQGKQLGPYYIPRKQYDKGVDKTQQITLLEGKELKKGEYFETYLMVAGDKQEWMREQLAKMLFEELKLLKDGAKEDSKESKSYRKERKIAHMLRKLIMVL